MMDCKANKKSSWGKKFASMSTAIMLATSSIAMVDMTFNAEVAEAATTYTVTATSLNVRASASTKAKVLGTVKKNAKLTVQGTSGDFYKIKYNKKTGYVSKKYVKKSTTTSASSSSSSSIKVTSVDTTNYTYTTTASLNMRDKNSTSGKVLLAIPKGKQLTVQGKCSNGWYKVKYNNKTGYVSGSYVKVAKKSSNNTSQQNVWGSMGEAIDFWENTYKNSDNKISKDIAWGSYRRDLWSLVKSGTSGNKITLHFTNISGAGGSYSQLVKYDEYTVITEFWGNATYPDNPAMRYTVRNTDYKEIKTEELWNK